MPIYEYCCEKCGEVFEEMQSGFDEHDAVCPQCSGNSKRIMSNTSFVLKGTGWYVTDYSGKNASFGAKGEESPKGNGNGNGSSSDSASSDSASSDAKPASESKPAEKKPATDASA